MRANRGESSRDRLFLSRREADRIGNSRRPGPVGQNLKKRRERTRNIRAQKTKDKPNNRNRGQRFGQTMPSPISTAHRANGVASCQDPEGKTNIKKNRRTRQDQGRVPPLDQAPAPCPTGNGTGAGRALCAWLEIRSGRRGLRPRERPVANPGQSGDSPGAERDSPEAERNSPNAAGRGKCGHRSGCGSELCTGGVAARAGFVKTRGRSRPPLHRRGSPRQPQGCGRSQKSPPAR